VSDEPTRFEVLPAAAHDGKLAFVLRDTEARRETPFLSLEATRAAAELIASGAIRADSYLGWSLDGPKNLAFPYSILDVPTPLPTRKARA